MTKRLKKGNVIDEVVDRDLCSGCGMCVGVCPCRSLSMAEAPNGDLTARWIDGPCPPDCGLCVAACPLGEGVLNPRSLNTDVFGPKAGQAAPAFHEDAGFYDSAFAGYAEANRATSASGGLMTWTLERLLAAGEVDRVAMVVCEPDDTHGYRFVFSEARTIEEVRQGSGSVYHQVEISDIIRQITLEPGVRWAISGVPCLCAGVRQAMQRMPKLRRSVLYLFGLVCGMYQNTFYTELLLAESGADRKTTTKVEYRKKSDSVPVYDYGFQGTDHRGPGKEIGYQGLPHFLGTYAFFRCNACNACMDVFAEDADACFMDAWLPEYLNEPRGTSIVLVRNPVIRLMMERGMADERINIDEIGIDRVIASQVFHVRRKRHLVGMRLGEKIDRSTGRPYPLGDRVAWAVQRYVQRRSKEAWADSGRSQGLKAFWRAAWDVSLAIGLAKVYEKTFGRASRLIARIRR